MTSKEFLAIGLMCGTSADGVDALLTRVDLEASKITDVDSLSIRIDPSLKRGIEELREKISENRKEGVVAIRKILKWPLMRELSDKSTAEHIRAVNGLIEKAKIKPSDVDVIGYHGQTVHHEPEHGITVQLGNGQVMADETGITTVYDFRSDDVLNGGQGAPLAPFNHELLARSLGEKSCGFINCGGTANISLFGDKMKSVGFDTGPGNALIDRFVIQRTDGKMQMDKNGKFGLNGQVVPDVLESLRQNAVKTADGKNFLEQLPPKSADSNWYYLVPELENVSTEDGCRTLAHFTAQCIVDSFGLLDNASIPSLFVLCGGGWYNPCITQALRELVAEKSPNTRIVFAEEVGINGDMTEAQIFGHFAVRRLYNMPLSTPELTGVKLEGGITGGLICLPHGKLENATPKVQAMLKAMEVINPLRPVDWNFSRAIPGNFIEDTEQALAQ